MITKEQIDQYIATQFYKSETAWQARVYIGWVLSQLIPEIEALNQHLKMTQTGLDAWYSEAMCLTDENAKLKAEITRLKAALQTQKQTR